MDEKTEAAVWSRVNAASPEREEARSRGPIGPELLEAMTKAKEAARELWQLSQKSGGETGRTLRSLSQAERSQERTLEALYFFLTGQDPAPEQPRNTARRERLSESLRRLMQGREIQAGRLEALAMRGAGESRTVLLELAAEERNIFRRMMELLKK